MKPIIGVPLCLGSLLSGQGRPDGVREQDPPLTAAERTLPALLVRARAIDPTAAWLARVRTLRAFECHLPHDGTTECVTLLSVRGQLHDDRSNAQVTVAVFDRDTDVETMFRKIKASHDSFTVAVTPRITYPAGNDLGKTWPTRCGESVGEKNHPAICYVQIDLRSGLYVVVTPGKPSAHGAADRAAQGQHDVARAVELIPPAGDLVLALVRIARDPHATKNDIPAKYGKVDYTGPGWYATEGDFMGTDVLAGPYERQEDCVRDLAQVKVSALAQGYHSSSPECESINRGESNRGRPPLPAALRTLPFLLTEVGAIDPTAAWLARVRTVLPFRCAPPRNGEIDCLTTVSVEGQLGDDQANGMIDVVVFDHDTDFATAFARISAGHDSLTVVYVSDSATTRPDPSGLTTAWPSSCGQPVGPLNHSVICYLQVNARTGLYLEVQPSRMSAIGADDEAAQGKHDIERTIELIGPAGTLIRHLILLALDPNATKSDIPNQHGRIKYGGKGWYARFDDSSGASLYAGPYTAKEYCVRDLPQVDRSARGQGFAYHLTQCDFLDHVP